MTEWISHYLFYKLLALFVVVLVFKYVPKSKVSSFKRGGQWLAVLLVFGLVFITFKYSE